MSDAPDPVKALADPDWDWLLGNILDGEGVHGDDPEHLRRAVRLRDVRAAGLGSPAKCLAPVPTVAFCGHGRAGKDTAAMFLAKVSPLRYAGSMSWWAKAYIAHRLGVSEQEAWETRHQRRLEWKALLNEYRAGDQTRLLRDTLARADIVPGIREEYEIVAGRKQGLLSRVVWVVNPRVPADPTVLYGPEACDFSVVNDDSHLVFEDRLLALFRVIKLPLLPAYRDPPG